MTFRNDETGAVTVDWVVLTAGLVGLGLATMAVVSTGVEDLSRDTSNAMSGQIIQTAFPPSGPQVASATYSSSVSATLNEFHTCEYHGLPAGEDCGTHVIAYTSTVELDDGQSVYVHYVAGHNNDPSTPVSDPLIYWSTHAHGYRDNQSDQRIDAPGNANDVEIYDPHGWFS